MQSVNQPLIMPKAKRFSPYSVSGASLSSTGIALEVESVGFHVSEVSRIARILADDPQLSNDEILRAIAIADRSIQQHRQSGKSVPFEVHRVRRILALAVDRRLNERP